MAIILFFLLFVFYRGEADQLLLGKIHVYFGRRVGWITTRWVVFLSRKTRKCSAQQEI